MWRACNSVAGLQQEGARVRGEDETKRLLGERIVAYRPIEKIRKKKRPLDKPPRGPRDYEYYD